MALKKILKSVLRFCPYELYLILKKKGRVLYSLMNTVLGLNHAERMCILTLFH